MVKGPHSWNFILPDLRLKSGTIRGQPTKSVKVQTRDWRQRTAVLAKAEGNRYSSIMLLRPIYITGERYEVIADHGGDVEATREQINRYTSGECMVLATRVFEITGWSIVAIQDGGGLPIHYLNRRPDGTYIDAHGQFPDVIKSLITHRHKVATPIWKKLSDDMRLSMDDETRREVDVFLNGAWMSAVIPAQDRRTTPLRRDDEDDDGEGSSCNTPNDL